MAKLKDMAIKYGEALETLIPRLIVQEGSISGAAKLLDVYPSAVRFWMNRNGFDMIVERQFRQIVTVVKRESATS